ncbi:hypothetical protein Patl1_04826 [Pistacia atlantica]|uniref:Uncharacterized protein n=1 Tax=Pistacia atlantica TaxID=434234 RepID=A0ACC1BUM9_9ROSI|nr:hypothetical protein Patl1_04826 [Pistacia atlantica]
MVELKDGVRLYQYKGFWIPSPFLHPFIFNQPIFQLQDTDIVLSTFPKSGTTWLKALAFAIVNRSHYPLKHSPLLTNNSHQLVPCLERDLYAKIQSPPRLIMATHSPYGLLPVSILNCNCRIVYLCRNPLDQFVSHWHFRVRLREQTLLPVSLEEAFEMMCNGVQSFGPIWGHMLEYWRASIEQPEKILFLKYEDLKEDIKFYVKKLANFLGCPFSEEEESQEMIKEIAKLCSFDNMKSLEVNKKGKFSNGFKNDLFFRKGEVGDWKKHLTPSMAERFEKLLEEKLEESGLTFKKL